MNEYVGSAIAPMESQTQEESWVAASRRGDVQAFNRLVLKWERTVYNVALRMLQNCDEAAEATQEVFLLAFKSIPRFRQDSRFSTWLYRIALNHCISRVKQRPAALHFSLDDPNATLAAQQLLVSETPAGELLRSEQRARVLSALSQLPPEQRAVVELRFFQELTFEGIAEVLEIPLSTIKSRLYSALEILKVRLRAEA
jgi:RNA polymerase sigma-70 factor, ECF subfamily